MYLPLLAPYQFASYKPINSINLDGLESFEVIQQPIKINPQITHSNIRKTSNEGFLQATYIHENSDGIELSRETVAGFILISVLKCTLNDFEM